MEEKGRHEGGPRRARGRVRESGVGGTAWEAWRTGWVRGRGRSHSIIQCLTQTDLTLVRVFLSHVECLSQCCASWPAPSRSRGAVIDYDNHDADVAKSSEGGREGGRERREGKAGNNTRSVGLGEADGGRGGRREGNGMASWREGRVGGRENWLLLLLMGRNRVFPRLFTFGLDVAAPVHVVCTW